MIPLPPSPASFFAGGAAGGGAAAKAAAVLAAGAVAGGVGYEAVDLAPWRAADGIAALTAAGRSSPPAPVTRARATPSGVVEPAADLIVARPVRRAIVQRAEPPVRAKAAPARTAVRTARPMAKQKP